jgi:hypothetical protein
MAKTCVRSIASEKSPKVSLVQKIRHAWAIMQKIRLIARQSIARLVNGTIGPMKAALVFAIEQDSCTKMVVAEDLASGGYTRQNGACHHATHP